jgi:hypothetical protein
LEIAKVSKATTAMAQAAITAVIEEAQLRTAADDLEASTRAEADKKIRESICKIIDICIQDSRDLKDKNISYINTPNDAILVIRRYT